MATVGVGVFNRANNKPLVGVTVAELDSDGNIVNSAETNSSGIATITTTTEPTIIFPLLSTEIMREVQVQILQPGDTGGEAHDHTTADGTGPLTGDEHDTFAEFIETSTPTNPATNRGRIFTRAFGNSIDLIFMSSQGQEALLARLGDIPLPANQKFLLLGVKQ